MSIAFMDAGYQGYLSNRFLEDAINNNRIPITYDFIANNPSVNENNAHGLFCLSIVAAHTPGVFIGAAPDASFYLLRTENENSEYPIEEFFWGIGAEFADSCGADVISSSVGYSTFDNNSYNHSYPELNGKTTLITKMANMAFRKGILVVNSAGNEGSSSWKYMLAPADSDSVLTVGAVNSTGTIASLSSFGPTYDKRIKPDALAIGIGTVLSSSNGELSAGTGTSFACPIIAGLATCLWQLFPETTNRQILEAIRKSGNRYAAPEAQYGFGIPDMKKAYEMLMLKRQERIIADNWVKAYPNPMVSYTNILVKAQDSGELITQLSDMNGRVYHTTKQTVQQGLFYEIRIDNLGTLAAGSYNVRVVNGQSTTTIRLVK
jgi:subtilisin family serine protease